jgi:hypothetical protein
MLPASILAIQSIPFCLRPPNNKRDSHQIMFRSRVSSTSIDGGVKVQWTVRAADGGRLCRRRRRRTYVLLVAKAPFNYS